MHPTLLVVAKRPTAGKTKTRLCPPLTGAQAAGLYECFLRDTIDIMRRVEGVRRAIAYLPASDREYFSELAPDMRLIAQRGQTLGERLDDLLTETLAGGAGRAVVMNSDGPTLPVEYLQTAFARLADCDVVLGPSRDGGYYLIGLNKPQPRLLREVQMSTPHVLTDTLALAARTGLSVSLLPEWYDVDTLDDLRALQDEISGTGNESAMHTRRWLAREALFTPPEAS